MADPWKAEQLGSGRFRFTNVSGGKLVAVVLAPSADGTEVVVEDGVSDDPWVVPAPVDAGESFIAVVRGAGVRITASTPPPRMNHLYWEMEVS